MTCLTDVVSGLGKQHDRRLLRAALIQQWLEQNKLPPGVVRQCPTATRLLQAAAGAEREAARRKIAQAACVATLEDLENGLGALADADRRRTRGAVYTPEPIIDYLVEQAIGLVQSEVSVPTICDPACGSGRFLVRAAEHLARVHGVSPADAFGRHLVGFDKDRAAVAHARCLIELFLAAKGQPLPAGGLRLFCADTLLDQPRRLWRAAGVDRGFDLVVGNPPYVRLQNLALRYRRQLIERYREFIKGSFSLALLFLVAGHRLLAPGGSLAYITQNNLFTSLAGEPIRRYLQQKRCIRRIVDFGHQHVFPNASAYTCLIFLGTGRRDSFQFGRVRRVPTGERLRQTDFSRIDLARLSPRKWRLAEGRHLDNLRRIEETGSPLGAVAAIRVGFATLRDDVFLVRKADGHCLAARPDGTVAAIECGITRPAVKIVQLRDERQLARNPLRVIFPYRKRRGRFQLIPEDELRDRFPKAYRYLNHCRDLLQSRDKGKGRAEGWYSWGRAQGREAPGPKLLTKTFDRRPNFMLDHGDQLFCNGYSVSLPHRSPTMPGLTIELLQRLLNSKVMHYYAELTSFQIAGGYQCYQKNFIEKFGVPHLTRAQADRLLALAPGEADARLAAAYGLPVSDLVEIVGE